MAEANWYEEQRRTQVMQNKRKLEELRVHHLSTAIRQAAAKPVPVPQPPKLRNPCVYAPTRRSSRLASLPEQPDYRDTNILSRSYGKSRGLPDRVYAAKEERAYAVRKAEELRDQLDSSHGPTFVKPLTLYYATGTGAGPAIPRQFSKSYLPSCNEMIFLVDEAGAEFRLLYLVKSSVLSAGWKSFAMDHDLADADCLVFQLVERTKFKVYIIRASSYYEKER